MKRVKTIAKPTVLLALCSPSGFWAMHDRIFANQESITPGNVKEKLGGFASRIEGLDAKAFRQCMDGGTSLGLVLRDMNLAEAVQVKATPTLFINGERVQGIDSAVRLRELISRARQEVVEHGPVGRMR